MQNFTRLRRPHNPLRPTAVAARTAVLTAALCIASPWAAAQSSVTIGGVIDLAARQTQVQG